ncbi:MAG: OmpA family protein [Porphyromonas sp.]|uniref:OmpA family protein n=1 Tax=Porphyromonas sp. TaxID=1924944 RepID=UPI001A4DA4AF|nr:OmpA family protein [Porphyromonas sp.]MBL6452634.1 OmpA family protein [Porphyromonas sp.]
MNRLSITAGIVAVALSLSGCGAINETLLGAGAGTAVGAGLGAGIGKVAGNTGAGAAIGAVVGGAAGALIGNRMEKQKKELEQQLPEGTQVETVNEGQAIKVVFDSGLLFNTSSSTLSSSSRADLRKFADNLNKNDDTVLEIIGHTDSSGNDRINDPLSLNRAKSVRDFLEGQGVSSVRMKYEGRGSHEPVDTNATAEGKRKNRRVEVFILPSQKMIEEAKAGTLK